MTEQDAQSVSPAARTLLGSIRVYQKLLSPFMGGNCRFHPSCSRYGYEAVQVHGAAKGSWLAVKRIGRCHPFNEGGLDPVPAPAQSDEGA
jgi:putative membrane protein insertion efficiency factor